MDVRKAIIQFDKFIEAKRKIGNVEIKINPGSFTAAINQMRKVKDAADDLYDAVAYAFKERINKEVMTSSTSTTADNDSLDLEEWAKMMKAIRPEEVKVLVFNLNVERKIRALEDMRGDYIVFRRDGTRHFAGRRVYIERGCEDKEKAIVIVEKMYLDLKAMAAFEERNFWELIEEMFPEGE